MKTWTGWALLLLGGCGGGDFSSATSQLAGPSPSDVDAGADAIANPAPDAVPVEVCPGGCTPGLVCSDGTDGHIRGNCWGCYHYVAGDAHCATSAPAQFPHYYKCVDSALSTTQCWSIPPGTTDPYWLPCCR